MGYLATTATLLSLLLLGAVTARLDTKNTKTVFLDKQEASEVITLSRQKRANVGNEESLLPANLERECLEEVCNYEEAREIFQDSYRTDIFWSVYIDGDQCAEKPCKNGAMCSDSVGGYDCVCKSGFFGVHCETDQTVCMLDKTKGCSQFCKPGYQSYECSCARGWKLEEKERVKCIPAVTFPCGKVNSLSQWTKRQSANIASNFEGLACNSGECPWQAILKSTESVGFCSGVILKENLVLTTAQCAQKYVNFQVAVGKRQTASEDGEQTIYVQVVHVHPRYVPGRPDNDLAVLELRERIVYKKHVVAACLPERDFAEVVLMTGEYPAVVTGWKDPVDATEVQGPLTLNHLAYERLPQCVERHPGLVTNKMGCTTVRPKGDCILGPGSPILSLHREVFYLTGVVSRPAGADCSQGYIYQKVSRFLLWLQPLMDSR
ncbi:coagulation factor X-like [Salvelinus namaycush]|uniref:Coagulation factor X-like n=1 Tax=Salvelinus namaycush TaxID=8040 RepID=A0A8U0UB64_SALNM|nr:coagulation factor X-like [Salvelinus namaycush]XP_038845492.1 coagulation factor X-like [Salvelinus namaycush]